ncbi:MAG TPA: SDR family NAD(P)-dependent oxidoreductase [bacterium]
MSGRVVIVTGASSGIGEATARAFARAGDHVILAARRAERLRELAAELSGSLAIPADLTKGEDITRVAAATLEAFGQIDVLVNDAGTARYDWLERLSDDGIRYEILLNLIAPVLLTKAVLPAMQARRNGVIINVSSMAGRIGVPTMSIYNAAKFGLEGFSEALRREVAPQGIRVCLVSPSGVRGTEFGRKGERAHLAVRTPNWLRVHADHVAAAIVALADHPRPRRVMPRIFSATGWVNALLPSVVDAVLTRRARSARRRLAR